MDERLATHLELARLPDEEFVDQAYRLVARRHPDEAGRRRALAGLADGSLSRASLLAELTGSAEFAHLRALDDGIALAAQARTRDERPRGFRGPVDSDERVVEIPWTLSRLRGEERVLDVGYAHADPAYLVALTAACPAELVGVDIVEAAVPGIRGVVADVRALPFEDEAFDLVLCISTLEHVGRDNRLYGGSAEADDNGISAALEELGRIVARHGRVLVTVPCGRREEFDGFVQLPPMEWLTLYDAHLSIFEHEVYVRSSDGWHSAGAEDAAALSYGEHGASAVLCAELRPRGLAELARRSLARLAGRGA